MLITRSVPPDGSRLTLAKCSDVPADSELVITQTAVVAGHFIPGDYGLPGAGVRRTLVTSSQLPPLTCSGVRGQPCCGDHAGCLQISDGKETSQNSTLTNDICDLFVAKSCNTDGSINQTTKLCG